MAHVSTMTRSPSAILAWRSFLGQRTRCVYATKLPWLRLQRKGDAVVLEGVEISALNGEEYHMNITQPTPVRLYLLQLALGEDGTPCPGYLIQTSDDKNILIDTGVPIDGSFIPNSGENLHVTSVVDQLATLGLAPRDIHFLVCTHFDPDHSGSHDAFPWSELIVQRVHYEFARASEDGRFTLTRPHWDSPGLRYRLIDGDLELVPGVELIETSGHVPGHQVVLVRLPQ